MKARRTLLCVLAWVVSLGAASVGGTVPAQAAGPPEGRGHMQIVSPARESLAHGRFIRLAVRVRRGTTIQHAFAGGRRVKLKKRRGGLRVGKLRRSSIDPGPESFVIHARTGSGRTLRDREHFFVAGVRRQSLLRLGFGGTKATGPLEVTGRLADPAARLQITLNGRRVHHLFERHSTVRSGSLSASDGLRFGQNTLRVVAFLNDGTYSIVKRSHRRDRTAPLAGAGPDRAVVAGRRLKLNAKASLATKPGSELGYRWKIVRRPAGSKAKLRGAGLARPSLRPDLPGVYRVALTVSEGGDGAAASAAAAAASGDNLSLTAQPPAGPIGVPLDTLNAAKEIQLGDQTFPTSPGFYTMVVFQRGGPQGGSLEPIGEPEPVPYGQESSLAARIGNDQTEMLMIGTQGGDSGVDYAALSLALGMMGGSAVTDISGGFSIVGIPGQASGQAYQYALGNGLVNAYNGMQGYLAKDSTGTLTSASWTMTPAEYLPFNLGAGGAPMVIGDCGSDPKVDFCQQIPLNGPAPAQGFAMAQLDPYTLQPLTPSAVVYENDSGGMQALASDLDGAGDGVILLLKSIGSPAPMTPEWFGVSQGIEAAGGNPQVFNRLNPPNVQPGTADYALVGGAAIKSEAKEVYGDSPFGGQFSMSGVLARDSNWRFSPMLADPSGGTIDYTLTQIAYQPPYEFQNNPALNFPLSGGPYAKAEADISQQVFCPDNQFGTGPCPAAAASIRSQYWLGTTDWVSDYGTDLTRAQFRSGGGYTLAQFRDLKNQLMTEWTLVDRVNNLMSNLLTPTVSGSGLQQADVQAITATIALAFTPPPPSNTTAEILEVFAAVAAGLSAVLAPEAAAPIAAAVIGGIGAGFSIASIFTTDSNGNRIVQEVNVKGDQVGVELETALISSEVGLERLRAILVSDWGKLSDVGNLPLIRLTGAPDALTTANRMLAVSGRRLAYRALVPLGAKADPGFLENAALIECVTNVSTSGPGVQLDSLEFRLIPTQGQSVGNVTSIANMAFATPTWSPTDLNAGEDPNDWWIDLWPTLGSGPCSPP